MDAPDPLGGQLLMPTPDPGYRNWLARQEVAVDITATEHSYVWVRNGEVHEFFPEFNTVHVYNTRKAVYG